MDNKAMFQISYGLYVLTSKNEYKDNGCIINTASQVTDTPNRITITVSKKNYTHDMISDTGVFNISILDTRVKFDVFKNFGFQSGRTSDKFSSISFSRSENGMIYLPDYSNAFISGKVISSMDIGTHTLFLADVTDGEMLSDQEPITYNYYHKNIKPAPAAKEKKGFRCSVCGYVYEGDSLPDDYVCPICKHGAEVFEKI